ncbi:MAG: hypothetical protein NUK62_04745 [Tenericutes bacterium]|jgi:hypothetical protein|nr:hypothetical protein [Mycoplasmatota bacterium]
MKERSLLYFITAVVASVLFLVALLIRTQGWFNTYGVLVMPSLHKLLIPVVLLWIGWYFENKGFLLSASIILTVLFGLHLDQWGVLNGDIFIVSQYAPAVRTAFVLGFILLLGGSGLGYYSYLTLSFEKKA